MKTYTVADIASFRGCTLNTVNGWIKLNRVTPDFKDSRGVRLYGYKKASYLLETSPQYLRQGKIFKCIDMHIQGMPVDDIAEECRLCTVTILKLIKAFKETGEITLESKLNFIL